MENGNGFGGGTMDEFVIGMDDEEGHTKDQTGVYICVCVCVYV